MDAAEELIAERGMGVSLREIAAHAGQRNNSAVIYHFGNHDGLIKATLERRMTELDAWRRNAVRDLVEQENVTIEEVLAALIEPALTLPYQRGATHYARFVEQIRTHPVIAQAVPRSETWPATMRLAGLLTGYMPKMSSREKSRRFNLMSTSMFALMADYERRGECGTSRERQRACRELVSILAAILTMPSTASTK